MKFSQADSRIEVFRRFRNSVYVGKPSHLDAAVRPSKI